MQSDFSVHRLSPPGRHCVHAYYDACPESPDGERVAWFEFDDEVPGVGRGVIADRDSGEEIWRTPDAVGGIGHVGAFFTFAGPDRVVCKRAGEYSGVTDLYDLSTGERREIIGDVRQIHTGTGLALFKVFPDTRNPYDLALALSIVDLTDAGRPTVTIDTYEIIEHCPDDPAPPRPETLHMQNLKWSPDGRRALIVYSDEPWRRGREGELDYPKYKVILTCDQRGDDIRFLTHFGHHPTWTPDGSGVIFYDLDDQGRQNLYRADLSGERVMLCEEFPGVHATLHPDRPWVVTDIFGKADGMAEVAVWDVERWQKTRLAMFAHTRFEHRDGFHPHPVFSRGGQRVYFNAMDGGRCGLHALELPPV